jgi:hypothetical protein
VCVSLGRLVWLRLMRTLRQSRNVFVTVLAAPSVGVNLSVSVIGRPEGFFFRSALPAAVTRTTTLTVVALPVRPDPVATVTVLVFLCLPLPMVTLVAQATLSVPPSGAEKLVLNASVLSSAATAFFPDGCEILFSDDWIWETEGDTAAGTGVDAGVVWLGVGVGVGVGVGRVGTGPSRLERSSADPTTLVATTSTATV